MAKVKLDNIKRIITGGSELNRLLQLLSEVERVIWESGYHSLWPRDSPTDAT
jgi:hypothetical protein